MTRSAIPPTLTCGWHQSVRTQAWHRKRNGWTAIVVTDDNGFRLVLKRDEGAFEDALVAGYDALNQEASG